MSKKCKYMKQKNKHWCMVYIKIKEYQESNVVNVI